MSTSAWLPARTVATRKRALRTSVATTSPVNTTSATPAGGHPAGTATSGAVTTGATSSTPPSSWACATAGDAAMRTPTAMVRPLRHRCRNVAPPPERMRPRDNRDATSDTVRCYPPGDMAAGRPPYCTCGLQPVSKVPRLRRRLRARRSGPDRGDRVGSVGHLRLTPPPTAHHRPSRNESPQVVLGRW